MHPKLRPGMATIRRILSGLRPGRCGDSPGKVRRRLAPEVAPLEGRALLSFELVNISVAPSTLFPPTGRFVPVTISGEVDEFKVIQLDATHSKTVFGRLPGRQSGFFQVVDEYQRDSHGGPIPLHFAGGSHGKFTFSTTTYLQASRVTEFPAGRRYYVTVTFHDQDGYNGQTFPVQVPISLTDRGPGPVKPPKNFHPVTRHPHSAATTKTSKSQTGFGKGLGKIF